MVRVFLTIAAALLLPSVALAQRSLHWDAIEVEARLDATGRLHVAETQTMVFTGEWNGGERTFNIRPRQRLEFVALSREDDGMWRPLREDARIDDIDEYAWLDRTTLRWRSRETADPAFANTVIRYRLEYELSNILLQQGDGYVLDHDFLFPDRDDVVREFTLRLSVDGDWQPTEPLQDAYTARNVRPGDGFVLSVPLRFSGATAPAALDTSRPTPVRFAVLLLIAATLVTVLWVLGREWSRGRFARMHTGVDAPWLDEHVLRHPAEVVGAAWDETIGSPEVVALIARMTKDGTLASEVTKGGVLSLRLNVARETLQGHERTIVDRLFFNNRTTTNTQLVKRHYRQKGFDPSSEIGPELHAAVLAAIPDGQRPRPFRLTTRLLMLAGIVLMTYDWHNGYLDSWFFWITIGALVLAGMASGVGTAFRSRIHWNAGAAVLCLLPAVVPALLAAWLLWSFVGLDVIPATTGGVWGITLLALAVLAAGANAMVSRQYPAGIAFRKRLGAARAYFAAQLQEERPALRDEWFPWLLALGLGDQMNDWSVRHAPTSRASRTRETTGGTITSSAGASAAGTWTGFGGGRSGGAGAGAAWTTAASGMAAGVSPPSSSGSSGGSSSSSSSGGSSGGGGGGGW
jgi:hypothetical protein